MQIRIVGQANFKQPTAEVKLLKAQVKALNKELAATTMIPAGGSPAGFARTARAVNTANAAFNAALASSGAWRVEQIRLNDVTNRYTELLQKQKLTFRDVWGRRNRSVMKAVYREQLAIQQSFAKVTEGMVTDGRVRATVGVPTEVHKSWDTLNSKIGFFRAELASASQQMINWGKNTQWAGRQLMVGFTMPVAAFGAAAGYMAYRADKEFTRIAKVYDTTADANSQRAEDIMAVEKEIADLREAGMNTAVEAARLYGSSLTDTLEVQAELAATGQKGNALQENTIQIQRIAALGEIEHAEATKALISLQSVLGLTTKETADAFNYMNSVENATSLSTNDFVAAIPRALGPMKEMGGSLQDLAVLMVAMKERGIEAGEGANAIKAMMQRLYRPSAQVREEWEKFANVDPLQIVKESEGEIMEILPRIADAVRDLDRPERVKLLSGLFGTYQVTRMSAMLKGLDDMENGVGQVSRVLEVNQQSWTDWADTADREMKRQAESASGRFKRVYAEVQAQLAVIGDPFLEVASKFMKGVQVLLSFFNNMPEWAKKGAIFVAILGALIGPVVMLIGLFANFAGNIGKFFSIVLKGVGSMELMNKSQFASRVAARLAESAFVKEASAAEILEKQMLALNQATRFQAQAMSQLAGIPLPPTLVPTNAMYGPTAPTAAQREQMYFAAASTRDESGRFRSNEVRLAEARNKLANEYLVANNQIARNASEQERTQQRITAQQKIQSQTTKVIGSNMTLASASGALMMGSMATMMLTSNETANNIAKWTMIGSMVVPAVAMLASGMGKALKAAKAYLAVQWAIAKAQMANAAGTARLAGTLGTATATARGLAAAVAGMMGPIGWAVTAVGALALIAYKVRKHEEAVTAEKEKQARAMYDQNNLLERSLEIQIKGQKRLSTLSPLDPKTGPSVSELADELGDTDSGKNLIEAYKNTTSETERTAIALEKYMAILNAVDGSAIKAQRYLEALFIAAGEGALEAQKHAQDFASEFGSVISPDEMSRAWAGRIEATLGDTVDSYTEQGKKIGELLATAIAEGGRDSANSTMDTFTDPMTQQWTNIFAQLDELASSTLSDLGVKTAEQFQTFMQDWNAMSNDIISLETFTGKYNTTPEQWKMNAQALGIELSQYSQDTDRLLAVEKEVAQELANQLNIGREITSMAQLRATWEWRLQTATKQNARSLYEQRVAEQEAMRARMDIFGIMGEMTDEQKLEILNQIRLALHMKQTDDLADGFKRNVADSAGEIDRAASKARGLAAAMRSAWSFSGQQAVDILNTGMSSVQERIRDMASSDFDNRMNASIEAAQNRWDNRIAAQEAAQDRQMDAFDNRWERRKEAVEDYYDKRIEAIDEEIEAEQKAEELRQRIFEAEQQRLQRLSEMANQGIDFNVALSSGNLDEAAKIRNDMEATAAEWALSDAAGRGKNRSERRQKRLEDKKSDLEERRDKELEAMQEREENERKHLERMQQIRSDALQEQSENEMEALRRNWEFEKQMSDERLELFMSYIARNKKDLERWMDEVGLSYDAFGGEVKRKGESWSKFFRRTLTANVEIAATEVANSNMWEAMGGKVAKKVLASMGFADMLGFEKFMRTGKLPKNFNSSGADRKHSGSGPGFQEGTFHGGGLIDGGKGSGRAGVARGIRGLHPSEQMIRAQKGEFVVNRDSAKRNRELLQQINSGKDFNVNPSKGVLGGAYPGFAGLVAGMAGMMLAQGTAMGMQAAFTKKFAKVSAMNSVFGAATPGVYGDISFDAEQLRNAKTIANVGKSLGMSARDIQIGIMTAITESGLRNINYGDRDSVGLFQQRTSQGWGTIEQIMNPEYAATKFFNALKAVTNRGDMSPWMAAQTVQRSAFSDGSNYRQYWDEGQAIFKALTRVGGKNAGVIGAIGGTGGAHKPLDSWTSSYSLHGSPPAYDLATPVGRNVYAVRSGKVVTSTDLVGDEPRAPHGGLGYRSYGRYIVIAHDGGGSSLYAHLSQRYARTGQSVRGGAVIGKSGNTGYSFGPHLHFAGVPSPATYLKTGGFTMSDGLAYLHKGEAVVTKPLTQEFHDGVKNFAEGGNTEYNTYVYVTEPGASAEEIADIVETRQRRREARRPQRRTNR